MPQQQYFVLESEGGVSRRDELQLLWEQWGWRVASARRVASEIPAHLWTLIW